MRQRGSLLFGVAGACCAAALVLLEWFLTPPENVTGQEVADPTFLLSIVMPIGFIVAVTMAYALWPWLRFGSRGEAFVSGAIVALLSHVPFSIMFVAASTVLWGPHPMGIISDFLGILFAGWIVAGIPEAVFGGTMGLLWHLCVGDKSSLTS